MTEEPVDTGERRIDGGEERKLLQLRTAWPLCVRMR